MDVSPALVKWIMDYLHGRTQRVRVGSVLSSSISTYIGAPQGCGLSPVLFTTYTNEHRGEEPDTFIPKYADDAALAGLISGDDESQYRDTIDKFVAMCDEDDLHLNTSKTKEMIIDFRRNKPEYDPVVIKGSTVEVVTQYDYLGTRVMNNLSWGAHIAKLASKAMKRIYHLRKLRQFQMSAPVMQRFYESVIEGVLFQSVAVWGGNTTTEDNKKINRVRRCAGRVMKRTTKPRFDMYKARSMSLAHKIMSDSSHPLSSSFTKLPSGRRYRQPKARTSRFRKTFVPDCVALLNK